MIPIIVIWYFEVFIGLGTFKSKRNIFKVSANYFLKTSFFKAYKFNLIFEILIQLEQFDKWYSKKDSCQTADSKSVIVKFLKFMKNGTSLENAQKLCTCIKWLNKNLNPAILWHKKER